MLKSLQIEPEKCTGCLQCEMACSCEASGLFNPAKSRIKVFTFHDRGSVCSLNLYAMRRRCAGGRTNPGANPACQGIARSDSNQD